MVPQRHLLAAPAPPAPGPVADPPRGLDLSICLARGEDAGLGQGSPPSHPPRPAPGGARASERTASFKPPRPHPHTLARGRPATVVRGPCLHPEPLARPGAALLGASPPPCPIRSAHLRFVRPSSRAGSILPFTDEKAETGGVPPLTPDLGLRGGQDPLLGAETRPWGAVGAHRRVQCGQGARADL